MSAIVTQTEVVRNDYNVSPSRYVTSNDVDEPLPLEDALVLLREADEARSSADAQLTSVIASLRLVGWHEGIQ